MTKITKQQLIENLALVENMDMTEEQMYSIKAIMIGQLADKMEMLEFFPTEVVEKIKDRLKAYDKVSVIFEYGQYSVSSAVMMKAHYGVDRTHYGYFHADEIFTKEERILNYVESFQDYPMGLGYKGKRDYKMLADAKELYGWSAKFKFDTEGNIVLA